VHSFKVKLIVLIAIAISPFNLTAAITVGNQTFENPTPASSTRTISTHDQNTGANGDMIVCVVGTSNFGVTVSGVIWDGVAMTQLQQTTITNDQVE
jgi:hypothetical protein